MYPVEEGKMNEHRAPSVLERPQESPGRGSICPNHGPLRQSWAVCPGCLRSGGARAGTVAIATKPRSAVPDTKPDRSTNPQVLLQIHAGDGGSGATPAVFPVIEGETTLGRDPRNMVVLADSAASRFHARIRRNRRDLLIEDRGSTNGTDVNGTRVTGLQPLVDGDTIQIGGTTLLVTFVA